MKRFKLAWICLLLSIAGRAESPPSKALEKPDWFYKPQWQEIWAKANPLLNDADKVASVLSLTNERWNQDAVAQDELTLVRAEALTKLGMPLIAQRLYSSIVAKSNGSEQAQLALKKLSDLVKSEEIDELALESLANFLEISIEPEPAAAMISYFKWRALSNRGMKDWAERQFKEIPSQSAWQGDLDYAGAVRLVSENDIDKAIEIFQRISKDERSRKITRQMAQLQYARLLFERQDFNEAFKLYQTLDLPLRERGRALLEMAWSQYYIKQYAEALGLLHALRSPVFDSSKSPERYILQMLILRDLCYYDEVHLLEKMFQDEYGLVYREIEARRAYDKNDRLAALTLLDIRLQRAANLVYKLRSEKAKLENLKLKDAKWATDVINFLKQREVDLRFQLDHDIRLKSREVADTLIDQREQIKFIGYSATIQSKADGSHKPGYEGTEIPALKFDTLYWPVRNREFWWDEASYYRALIKSRCGSENDEVAK